MQGKNNAFFLHPRTFCLSLEDRNTNTKYHEYGIHSLQLGADAHSKHLERNHKLQQRPAHPRQPAVRTEKRPTHPLGFGHGNHDDLHHRRGRPILGQDRGPGQDARRDPQDLPEQPLTFVAREQEHLLKINYGTTDNEGNATSITRRPTTTPFCRYWKTSPKQSLPRKSWLRPSKKRSSPLATTTCVP